MIKMKDRWIMKREEMETNKSEIICRENKKAGFPDVVRLSIFFYRGRSWTTVVS